MTSLTKESRGHRRCRIACSNCRRRKIKCISDDDHPRSPCKRCLQHGCPCEYVSVSEEELSSPEPTTPENGAKWLPPLGPESYGRPQKQDAIPTTPQPKIFDGYAPAESMYLPDPQSPASFYTLSYPQNPSYPSSYTYGDASFDVWDQARGPCYPSVNIPLAHYQPVGDVYYGQFPGPANTVYPWMR